MEPVLPDDMLQIFMQKNNFVRKKLINPMITLQNPHTKPTHTLWVDFWITRSYRKEKYV